MAKNFLTTEQRLKNLGKGRAVYVVLTCVSCNKDFSRTLKYVNKGFGKYCSMSCRKNGITINCFNCKKEVLIPPSRVNKSKHHFCSLSCSAKYNSQDEKNPRWKGNKASYISLHQWIMRKLGKPNLCQECGKSDFFGRFIHWANISGEYKRDINDWRRLCASCHKKFDKIKGKSKILKWNRNYTNATFLYEQL